MGKDAETKGQTAMSNPRLTVLVVGATGSIGRLVVEEAVSKGRAVRSPPAIPQGVRHDLEAARREPGAVQH